MNQYQNSSKDFECYRLKNIKCSELKLEKLEPIQEGPEWMMKEYEELKEKLIGLLHNVVLLKDAENDAYTPVSIVSISYFTFPLSVKLPKISHGAHICVPRFTYEPLNAIWEVLIIANKARNLIGPCLEHIISIVLET